MSVSSFLESFSPFHFSVSRLFCSMERKLSKKMPSDKKGPPLTHQTRNTTITSSRPPLVSRIRASFEGKRKDSKSDTSSPGLPPDGFLSQQDPAALIQAVEAVMNGKAFQSAISANLAKLLKPTITDALDTIQPVVEAVYSHEMLLRKTNKSVENLLEKLDTVTEDAESIRAQTPRAQTPVQSAITPRKRGLSALGSNPPANLETIKHMIEDGNAKTAAKLASLSDSVGGRPISDGSTALRLDPQIASILASKSKILFDWPLPRRVKFEVVLVYA